MPSPARLAVAVAVPVILVIAAATTVIAWGVHKKERLPINLPGVTATWSTGITSDTLHAGQGPAFPDKLDGWQQQRDWTEITRAFTGQWTSVCGSNTCNDPYPATMNGCANQRFLIRWRSLNDPVLFAYGEVTGDIGTIAEKQLTEPATQGWAELTGCSWPLWQYTDGHPSTLGDITVAVQQWTPTP